MYVHNTAVIWANGEVEGFSAFAFTEHEAREKALRKVIKKANDIGSRYKLLNKAGFDHLSPGLKQQIKDDWKLNERRVTKTALLLMQIREADFDVGDMSLLKGKLHQDWGFRVGEVVVITTDDQFHGLTGRIVDAEDADARSVSEPTSGEWFLVRVEGGRPEHFHHKDADLENWFSREELRIASSEEKQRYKAGVR